MPFPKKGLLLSCQIPPLTIPFSSTLPSLAFSASIDSIGSQHAQGSLLEAGLMPLLGRVVGALTDSRGVGDSSWRGSWVEVFR